MSGSFYPPVEGLSDENIARVREAFRLYDRDGEGTILARELGTVMKSLGHNPSPVELTDMINEVDFDGSGVIHFQDFQHLVAKRVKTLNGADELREAFRVYDRERKGYISSGEFRQIVSQIGDNVTPEDIDEMVKEADLNKNGRIEYEEFVNTIVHK